jgi:hypothetical protein
MRIAVKVAFLASLVVVLRLGWCSGDDTRRGAFVRPREDLPNRGRGGPRSSRSGRLERRR